MSTLRGLTAHDGTDKQESPETISLTSIWISIGHAQVSSVQMCKMTLQSSALCMCLSVLSGLD